LYENAWDNRKKESEKTLVYYQGFFSSLYIFLPIFVAIYCGVLRGHPYINVCICANAFSIAFSVPLSRATHSFLDVSYSMLLTSFQGLSNPLTSFVEE
jgi:hypothetical protein